MSACFGDVRAAEGQRCSSRSGMRSKARTAASTSGCPHPLVIDAPTSDQGVVEHRALSIRKLRDGPTGEQTGFSLEKVSLGVDEDDDEITTRVYSQLSKQKLSVRGGDFCRDLEIVLIDNRDAGIQPERPNCGT